MKEVQFTLIRKNKIVTRVYPSNHEETLKSSFLLIYSLECNAHININIFAVGDILVQTNQNQIKYILTNTQKITSHIKLDVIEQQQYLFEKELHYGIIRKQFLNFLRGSGILNAVISAILISIFLKLLDKLYSIVF
jgi:hypothetical protein